MRERFIWINGVSYPLNLKILMEEEYEDDNKSNYHLMDVYCISTSDGIDTIPDEEIIDFYPVIIAGTSRVIFTASKEIIKKIWMELPPKKSRIIRNQFLVHENQKVAYNIPYYMDDVFALMDEEEYNSLIREKENPFIWSKDSIKNNVSFKKYLKSINSSFLKI